MIGNWTIYLLKGATYEATITMSGVADIATATEWRVRCVDEAGNAIFTASSVGASPMLVSLTTSSYRLTIPAATTATMDVEAGYYDFEVLWTGGTVRRYIARGNVQVIAKAGT
jgi:hypothetical protein